jgi:hypothetical protein
VEHQLWGWIVARLASLDKTPAPTRHDFSDAAIAAVYYWAVVHERPTAWACRRVNWPIHLRRRPRPSEATMSRRLRSPSVVALLAAVARQVSAPATPGVFWVLDGKPLPVGGATGDPDAGYGRAAGGMAKGYKLHALANARGELAAWEVAPMNVDERVVAARLVRAAGVRGYVVADANYDSNPLHAVCDAIGDLHLVTPRRHGPGRGLGHHRHAPGRLRGIGRLEGPAPAFARHLLDERDAIERGFGNLTNWGGGLTGLPPWVRTLPRVTRWVQAKLALNALKPRGRLRTSAA